MGAVVSAAFPKISRFARPYLRCLTSHLLPLVTANPLVSDTKLANFGLSGSNIASGAEIAMNRRRSLI
jgi:hypothetical protein